MLDYHLLVGYVTPATSSSSISLSIDDKMTPTYGIRVKNTSNGSEHKNFPSHFFIVRGNALHDSRCAIFLSVVCTFQIVVCEEIIRDIVTQSCLKNHPKLVSYHDKTKSHSPVNKVHREVFDSSIK